MMSNVAALSRPVEISSHKNKLWPPTNISPTVTRLRSPPDTPRSSASPTTVSEQFVRPRMCTNSSVRSAAMSCISFASECGCRSGRLNPPA
ncbi:TPA: hypothetical protein N0F65_009523 [Lagenidium giganteum]|uniref:Uncharacterized protein n=1 Tax=Lagenidium giganteum TaxID=4803 RepID=A0AAV2YRZ8_9STRA|nr:TPA: hypothetical protein N0F65_009523 [Lagenidium giganteum]